MDGSLSDLEANLESKNHLFKELSCIIASQDFCFIKEVELESLNI